MKRVKQKRKTTARRTGASRPASPARKRTSPRPGARRPSPVARSLPKRTKIGTAEGVFTGTARGYGFVFPDGSERRPDADVFIPAGRTGGALDGDRVAVRFRAGYDRRTEGEVTAILAEARKTLIGVLVAGRAFSHGRFSPRDRFKSGWYLIPDDAKVPGEFPVYPSPDAEPGDRVEIALPGRRGGVCR
ncbi:MAG: hypothetical protein J6P88_02345, partial [Clostridia bacterium]|nr:hypothetical protein [Clostridia bacterium]